MQFHRALASGPDLEAACRHAATTVRAGLGAGPIDLVVAFASARYGQALDRLPVLLHDLLDPRALVGCSAAAVVDDAHELDADQLGVAVLAGRIPGARLHAVTLGTADLPSPDAPPAPWRALLGHDARDGGDACGGMIVLAEPFHCDVRALLAGLDFAFPGVTKLGGIASGSRHPDGHAVFHGRSAHRRGAVVLTVGGDVELATVSTRGCRPFGRVGRVTRSDQRRLLAVDDRPARTFVQEQLEQLADADREAVQRSPLLLAITPDPFADAAPGDGEFLVCNILGVDQTGNLVLAEHLPAGRTVRLLLRDEAGAAAELRAMLATEPALPLGGAIAFRCLGREGADHLAFAAACPGVPLAGFHCNGEIAPIAGATHVQAYTATFGLFRARARQ